MSDYRDSLISIPNSWKCCRFKDVYESKKEIVGDRVNKFERLALTLKGVIKRSKEDDKGLQPTDFETYQILRKNDMVFKMIDLQNVSTSRVGRTPWDGLVSPAYLRFTPKYDDPGFMFYYFMSLYYRNVFNNIAGDGVRSALNSTDIGNIVCPFPNIEEQQNIVEALDKKISQIDKLIANQEKQIEKLKENKINTISDIVTRGLSKSSKFKETGIYWIGKIPYNWGTIRIKYTSWLKGRIGWDGLKSTEFIEEGPYLITGTDFVNGEINWDTCVHISEQRFSEDELLHIKEDDLLITKDGTIGKLAIVKNCPEKVSLNSGVMIIRNVGKYEYLNKYLYYVLQSNQFTLWYELSQSGNSTIKHLYQGQFYEFEYTYPPLNEQQEIANYLDNKCTEIDKLIVIKEKKIELLKHYKKSIIYEYVTGKKVTDINGK